MQSTNAEFLIKNTRFYSVKSEQGADLTFGGMGFKAKPYAKLVPNGGNSKIDVINQLHWKNSGSADEVPYINAVEKELQYGMWAQNISRIFTFGENLINGEAQDPYQQLYAAKPTGFNYSFPWLVKNGDNIRSINNSWGEISSGIPQLLSKLGGKGNKLTDVLGGLAGGIVGAVSPGVGFEKIQEYKDTNQQEITVEFPLYNTASIQNAFDNYAFVSLFSFQNLKTRTSFMTFIPPKIYSLDSGNYGGVYWPLAYVSNFKIDSIGTTRNLSEFSQYTGGVNLLIPEAYRVSITFKELLPQSSNIFAGTMGGYKVNVSQTFEDGDLGRSVFGTMKKAGDFVNAGNAFQPKVTYPQQNQIPDGGKPVGNPYYPNDNSKPSITITGAENIGQPKK